MPARVEIRNKERVDDLIRNGLKIIQNPDYFCFSIDAVLLAHFATLAKGYRVVDLGTGTGVIPLLLTSRQRNLDICGLEIQDGVAEMAARSVALNGLEEHITIKAGDLRLVKQYFPPGSCDLVTANPPYQPLGKGRVNPCKAKALARHELACNLADMVKAAAYLLKPGGYLAMVHRPERLSEIFNLFVENKINPQRFRPVYSKEGQRAGLVLLEGVVAGKGDLEVLSPLIIYRETGEYTEEVMEIYFGRG